MTFNPDISQAPRDAKSRIIVTLKCGRDFRTWWHPKRGAWVGLATGQEITGWKIDASETKTLGFIKKDNAMSDSTDLITMPDFEELPALFEAKGKIMEIVSTIEAEVTKNTESTDVETAEGRKFLRSISAKVSSSKVAIEKAGKSKTEEWRKKTKEVNEISKSAVERLEKLRDDTKAPVLEWEERESKRVQEIQARTLVFETDQLNALSSAAELQSLISRIDAVEVDESFAEFQEQAETEKSEALAKYRADLDVAEKREAQEAELAELRAEKEKRDAEEQERLAAEQAKREEEELKAREEEEAKQRAKAEKEAADRAAKEAEERAAQEKAEAEELYKIELREARLRAERAEEEARLSVEREQRRKAEEEAQRLADEKHRATIKSDIANALAEHKCTTLLEIAEAILSGAIPHVKVTA